MNSIKALLTIICLLSIETQLYCVVLQSRDGDFFNIEDAIAYDIELSNLSKRFPRSPKTKKGIIILKKFSSSSLRLLQNLLNFANNVNIDNVTKEVDLTGKKSSYCKNNEQQIQEAYNQFKDEFDLNNKKNLIKITNIAHLFKIQKILTIIAQAMVEIDLDVLANYLAIDSLSRYNPEARDVLIKLHEWRRDQIQAIHEIQSKEETLFESIETKAT